MAAQPASLSARRAWIEIQVKRSVTYCIESLSARRAWIEIYLLEVHKKWMLVALRKESVDRNWQDIDNRETIAASLSARRAWIEIGVMDFAPGEVLSLSARRAWIEI